MASDDIVVGYAAIGNVGAFPEALVKKVRLRGLELVRTLCEDVVEITYFIDSFDEMKKAVTEISRSQVDLLVINVCTWVDAGITIGLFKALSNKKIILWSFAEDAALLPLTALIEITSTVTKLGHKFLTLLGPAERKETSTELELLVRVFASILHIEKASIGLIGYNSPGMIDSTPDEIAMRRYFGAELKHLDLQELVAKHGRIDDISATKIANDLLNNIGRSEVDKAELVSSCKLYLAMREIVQKYELSAIAIRCWPELKGNVSGLRATPCYALSKLTDEGVIGACEADVSSLVTMMLLKTLSGLPPVMLDYNRITESQNTISLWHCGAHASSIVGDLKEISLRHPSEGGLRELGDGMALEFALPPGKATLAKITREYNKIVTAGIQFVKPSLVYRGGIAEGTLDVDARTYFKIIVREGFEHHVCAVYKEVRKELSLCAQLLGIELIEI